MAPSSQKLNLKGVCEVKFFDRTNRLAARTKKRIAAKRLVVSTNFISKTPPKIQFWLLVNIFNIFGSKFSKITDRENASILFEFAVTRLRDCVKHVELSICD